MDGKDALLALREHEIKSMQMQNDFLHKEINKLLDMIEWLEKEMQSEEKPAPRITIREKYWENSDND